MLPHKTKQFFDILTDPLSCDFSRDKKVIALTGKSYNHILFSTFVKRVSEKFGLQIESPSEAVEISQLVPKLETSFLGSSKLFWLKDLSKLSAKALDAMLTYLSRYSGPHKVVCFVPDSVSPEGLKLVRVPELCGYEECRALGDVLYPRFTGEAVLRKVFLGRGGITPDSAMMLVHYARLLGRKPGVFVEEWLDRLVGREKSLFELSGLLLGKKAKSFFHKLERIEGDYPPVFWTAFWSEQIRRAFSFVTAKKAKNDTEARTTSARLPFSSIRKDWRGLSCDELQGAHNFLYNTDFLLKNGCTDARMSLFYTRLLTGTFQQS